MESLVVVSKVKKFIKEQGDCNTASNLVDGLSAFVRKACNEAIESAKRDGRKTVMGRDFIFNDENAQTDAILVVASKVKDYIREQASFNTSAQVMGQLSLALQDLCKKAIENAKQDKRKTVMDRDLEGLF